MKDLQALRERLSRLDVELLEMVARRQEIVAEIGRAKSSAGRGTRDYAREKDVLELARRTARRVGLDEDIGEEMFRLLIRASLAAQELDKVSSQGSGSGKRALVIGGSGQMGQWFVRFLDTQGYAVEICDPQPARSGHVRFASLDETGLEHDLVVIAAPIQQTVRLLERLAERKPGGIIFDISSLKGPLAEALGRLRAAGCHVTSIHPMFGPDTELLSGRNVVFVDLGDPDATAMVQELFASTMAEQVSMSLDGHDRAMAYVLGLSHAVNIAFFNALSQSGEEAEALATLSSSTFDAQMDVASRVAEENPYLYFEIQSLNAHSPRALVTLLNAVTQVAGRVLDGDEQGFVDLMAQGKAFLARRPEDRP
ncbi:MULTISPECIES: prephenate dehydrogenase/arogenate dehydrogenase family protein [Sedimenticola]|mgnify:CR=1 FL=1|uniref:chorismate mutase n=1 Tax=Sedimenticola selenatireducens TaxID=191960 RepID=A0A2N6CTZ2_9GAMM|nr:MULTISPECIES: prephenate dehydrogenase/arogenate dehydrogenase family protein [Sedimenticola]MCW8902664.1 prephenate dehydrogenase/arogenate dehydrogenase family protein [Sedimenticola sp.]PLX60634.1 MAG: prephenate dehydrogenase/arogenate dehydrogenase family protein [Sedimenticola selenatireducens]